ncbi:beta-microseminoprotein [Bubalus kerabau]|uniref:beta-microseminoprotein n=1 Tax=Bubalus carabanensis TaxID=3119969 RepID=UPI00244E73ED|nr:beta-microseminoprotein [Bubalus carabanensis]
MHMPARTPAHHNDYLKIEALPSNHLSEPSRALPTGHSVNNYQLNPFIFLPWPFFTLQNALLFSFVVLATFVTLCNAQCYLIPNESSASNGSSTAGYFLSSKDKKRQAGAGCLASGESRALGLLELAAVHVAIPMGYDRDKCQAVFNKETCTYTVLEKKNPLKNCTVTAWVL